MWFGFAVARSVGTGKRGSGWINLTLVGNLFVHYFSYSLVCPSPPTPMESEGAPGVVAARCLARNGRFEAEGIPATPTGAPTKTRGRGTRLHASAQIEKGFGGGDLNSGGKAADPAGIDDLYQFERVRVRGGAERSVFGNGR